MQVLVDIFNSTVLYICKVNITVCTRYTVMIVLVGVCWAGGWVEGGGGAFLCACAIIARVISVVCLSLFAWWCSGIGLLLPVHPAHGMCKGGGQEGHCGRMDTLLAMFWCSTNMAGGGAHSIWEQSRLFAFRRSFSPLSSIQHGSPYNCMASSVVIYHLHWVVHRSYC